MVTSLANAVSVEFTAGVTGVSTQIMIKDIVSDRSARRHLSKLIYAYAMTYLFISLFQ